MTCTEFSILLDQYLEGSLDAQLKDNCDQHLENCADCRLLLEIRKDCQQLDEGFEVPASFSATWRQAIREQEESDVTENQKESRRPIISIAAKRLIALAASLVFVFGGTWLVRQSRQESVSQTAQYADAGGMPELGQYYAAKEQPAPSMLMAEESVSYDASSPSSASGNSAEPKSDVASQKIIRTLSLSLSTRSFDADLAQLNTALAQHGGYVEYSDISADRGTRRYANLTLRVPKDRLDSYLSEVKGVGQLISISESQEDVSERYSDNETRLKTQTTKMERLLDLLSKASRVEDILDIEREIANTQYEIDRLTGSLRGMDSKVDYSTVNLYLAEEIPGTVLTEPTLMERIRLAVSDAWRVILNFLEDLLVLITVVLPYLIVLVVLIVIIKKIIRRKKK